MLGTNIGAVGDKVEDTRPVDWVGEEFGGAAGVKREDVGAAAEGLDVMKWEDVRAVAGGAGCMK